MADFDKYAPTLYLKVLRGQDLLAMDSYGGLSAAKSDPYCVVKVGNDDAVVGKTETVCNTCDPVWPKPEFFEVKTWGRVTVEIWDWDVTSEDDPMGQVSFVVKDVELEHRAKGFSPLSWFKVMPSSKKGAASGWLQVLLVFQDEIPGARLASFSERSLPKCLRSQKDDIQRAKTPVYLNYYDLGHSTSISHFNKISPYGAFHSGVEMYDTEFSYGGTKKQVTGIFVSRPRRCAMHTYKGSVYLGDCCLRKAQIEAILKKLRKDWWGPHYDLFKRNCCFFCREFAISLGLGEIPSWTYKLADLGATLRDALPLKSRPSISLEEEDADGDRGGEINAVLIEHIMAVRMQRTFRARRERRAQGLPTPKAPSSRIFSSGLLQAHTTKRHTFYASIDDDDDDDPTVEI